MHDPAVLPFSVLLSTSLPLRLTCYKLVTPSRKTESSLLSAHKAKSWPQSWAFSGRLPTGIKEHRVESGLWLEQIEEPDLVEANTGSLRT